MKRIIHLRYFVTFLKEFRSIYWKCVNTFPCKKTHHLIDEMNGERILIKSYFFVNNHYSAKKKYKTKSRPWFIKVKITNSTNQCAISFYLTLCVPTTFVLISIKYASHDDNMTSFQSLHLKWLYFPHSAVGRPVSFAADERLDVHLLLICKYFLKLYISYYVY